MKQKKYSITAIILFNLVAINLSTAQYNRTLRWTVPQSFYFSKGIETKALNFENCTHDASQDFLPFYTERIPLSDNNRNVTYVLADAQYADLKETDYIMHSELIPNEVIPEVEITTYRKTSAAWIKILPLRKNQLTGGFEKLISFRLEKVADAKKGGGNPTVQRYYAPHSVLSSGMWYKIAVTDDGIYKLTYNFLKGQLGISDLDNIDPHNIRVYGNGGGMVPVLNSVYRPDDLMENAIYVAGESDGKFDHSDYVLFYGQSQDKWSYSSSDQRYHHQKNLFSDTTFYFINVDLGPGKRIQPQQSTSLTPTDVVTTFDDYKFYESDRYNLIKSGREWYGDAFDVQPSQDFSFNFPNLNQSIQAYMKVDFAARSFNGTSGSDFSINYNGQQLQTVKVGGVPNDFTAPYCATAGTTAVFNAVNDNIGINISFSAVAQPANGWLNYLEVNTTRNLSVSGSVEFFRNKNVTGLGKVAQYQISNVVNSNYKIWEVTSPYNVSEQQYLLNGTTAQFTLPSDSLRQFAIFDNTSFKSATAIGQVENQDLHSLPQTDLIIVTHPLFLQQANRLADFHRAHDTLRVVVATTEQIYNEYSSGAQDISAIRDFAKMFYDRAITAADLPRYLLLVGDGSYDNKNKLYATGNYIVTYQSLNSCAPTGSYCSDDFFALLDDSEGIWNTNEESDLGVGRIPVGSSDQAKIVVDKIINYSTIPGKIVDESVCNTTASPLGDWRNILCFIADDQNGTLHVSQSDGLSKLAQADVPGYNTDKIYLDAFQQVSTPGGQRYPSVKDAINKRVDKGALLINYTGHGGELGWTEERVLEVSDIRSWSNLNKLPVFITATCEFSRYDDPSRTSAGELVLVNGLGGGIALFTTTRLAFSNTNENINRVMIDSMFTPINGAMPRMGDIFAAAKRQTATDAGQRNFALLGDPALRMAYPEYDVVATQLNGVNINVSTDTLEALSLVTIKGEVRDKSGNKLSTFNGVVYPTIYDKVDSLVTLRNDSTGSDQSGFFPFTIQKSILYKGKASVTNGDFEFSFIVPKDIKYSVGKGRLSFYAQNGFTDAQGYNNNVLIGGINLNAKADNKGPELKLYLNSDKFVFGGLTNESPSIYALLNDSNGINTVGNGIGHDITAQLDKENDKIYSLNDYYLGDLNSYSGGKVIYPLEKLSSGRHSISFKAWDIYNNSSEAYTEFVVAESAKLALEHVLNYPNPFTTKTKFFFEQNLACQTLRVEIKIFTVSGKLIKNINQYVNCDGYRLDGIEWDGRDDFGDAIGKGVYLYKLKVASLEGGQSAEKIEKLVVLK
ncbi:MAG: type IX secretion system sortase PorU [Bacteroidia bacterium]